MDDFVEITQHHVARSVFHAFGKAWPVSNFIGQILPSDVGKRVYLRNGILQVENDEQRERRLKANMFPLFPAIVRCVHDGKEYVPVSSHAGIKILIAAYGSVDAALTQNGL